MPALHRVHTPWLAALALWAGLAASGVDRPADGAPPVAPGVPAFQAPETPPKEGQERPAPPVEAEGPLALEQALALALMGNPSLAAFSWEQRATEARELTAAAPRNPELNFRYYRIRDDTSPPDEDEARRRLILSQVFEPGGKRRHRLEIAQSESDLAGWDYEAKRVEVATAVAGAFAGVAGSQRRVAVWKEALRYFEGTRDRVAALIAAGRMRSLKAHEVQRRIGLTRIELGAAEAELRASRLELASLWGSAAPRFSEVSGELEPLPPVPELEAALAAARTGPDAARWEAELARGQATISAAKSLRVPDVVYGVGVRWDEDSDRRDYVIDLGITLPVFDYGRGDLLEARHTLSRVEAERKASEVERDRAIAETHGHLVSAEANRRALAEEVVPATRASFEAHRVGFERAAEDPGDLLDARRDLARAESAYIDALVDYHRALGALEALVGRSPSAPSPP